MPAVSEVQQQAAGAELARRRAGKARRKFGSMSTADLEKYASTKRKGLPHRKGNPHAGKSLRGELKARMRG